MSCECEKSLPDGDLPLDGFFEIRGRCSALQLIIPESFLETYREFLNRPLDKARHSSAPYLAYKRKRLKEFTAPVHFLIDEAVRLKSSIANQYKRDLEETWLLGEDYDAKFKRARRFYSRIIELRVAADLKARGHDIIQLESLGGAFDIVIKDKVGEESAVEVKFLPQELSVFSVGVAAISSGGAATSALAMYSPYDYLLFRVHEGAKQLQTYSGNRIVVAVLYDYALSFKIGLNEGWIDWNNPKFLKLDNGILPFLESQYSINPNLDADVVESIRQLNAIEIYAVGQPDEITLTQQINCAGQR